MTVLTGVVGFPVEHSKSPLIHGYWLKKYGINGTYVPLKIAPENLTTVLKALPLAGFKGVNVTVPHKVAVLSVIDELSEEARKAGAVNTVFFKDDGTVYGHNTDGYGFMENVRSVQNVDWKNACVAVLGTGGAARGICAALTTAGCAEIRLVYRTLEKAEMLKKAVGGNVVLIPWKDRNDCLDGMSVLSNATTLGMNGFEKLDVSLEKLPSDAVVTDAVYAPLETDLLKRAKQSGFKTADGLGMLLHQARPAFQTWFGVLPDVTDDLRRAVL